MANVIVIGSKGVLFDRTTKVVQYPTAGSTPPTTGQTWPRGNQTQSN